MAVLNARIIKRVMAAPSRTEITERNVMGVPAVTVGGKEFGEGRMTLTEIVAKMDTSAKTRRALNAMHYDVLIVSAPARRTRRRRSARRHPYRSDGRNASAVGCLLDTVDIEKLYLGARNREARSGGRAESACQRLRR